MYAYNVFLYKLQNVSIKSSFEKEVWEQSVLQAYAVLKILHFLKIFPKYATEYSYGWYLYNLYVNNCNRVNNYTYKNGRLRERGGAEV